MYRLNTQEYDSDYTKSDLRKISMHTVDYFRGTQSDHKIVVNDDSVLIQLKNKNYDKKTIIYDCKNSGISL